MMLAITRSKPGQNACAPGGARAAPRAGRGAPTTTDKAVTRSRARPRTCARSGARSRPGRAARARSRTTPKRIFQKNRPPKPSTWWDSALAPVAITISSKTDQPRHWRMFRPVGRYEPRRPSGARMQHHRRHPRVGADQAAEAEHQVPDDCRRGDRAERDRQREREAALRARAGRGTRRRRSRAARPRGWPRAGCCRASRADEAATGRARYPTAGASVFIAASLRRHDPDQVRRV